MALIPFVAPTIFIALLGAAQGGAQDRFNYGGVSYEFVRQSYTFDQAENNCKKLGGHLATVTSGTVNGQFQQQLRNKRVGSSWIGYSDQQHEGRWQWANPSGRCKTFTRWHRGEPNGRRGENCAMLYRDHGTWNDINCGARMPSICEFGSKSLDICPDPNKFQYEGVSYIMVTQKMNFNDAENSCKKLGGHLITVSSSAMNGKFQQFLKQRNLGDSWIGYSDQQHEGRWQWANPSGSCKTFTRWNRGEPNGKRGENCGMLYRGNGHWNDVNCNAKLLSICEIGDKAKQLCGPGGPGYGGAPPVDGCIELYNCQWGKSQHGHDIAHTKENSKALCAKQCCNNKQCIGFDYDTKTKDCWLSKTPQFVVGLSNNANRWACQKKDINTFEFGGVTYKLFPQKLTYNDAANNCKKRKGNLITITDNGINGQVQDILKTRKLGDGWIGFSDQKQEGRWTWENPSASCKKFTRWNRREPNGNRGENCAMLYTGNGNWNDINCGNKFVSVCEFGSGAEHLCPKPPTAATPGKCSPFNERYPAEGGAPGGITRCTSNGDPHLMTFDGRRYDNYRIGDWVMVKSDRRDFSVHARTHHCWRVACNCGVVVKEGQDVISVNYCGNGRQGNRHNPYVGFMSNREPAHGTGLERSGRVYRIKLASGAFVQLRINMNHQALWVDINIGLPSFDYKHVDGMCGSWDRNRNNDRTEWRASPEHSLFFYKPAAGKTCLAKDACNPDKKFKAQGGWKNLVFPGQQQCDKEREEPTDPNAEVLPTGAPNPTAGLPATPEAFTPAAPKCPTPNGKTTAMATKKCTEQLTQTETYKACKRVLGNRFTITEAVAQCVADVCATDDYKLSIDSAFDTMKIKCLDEANEKEKEDITSKTCPNECSGRGKCNNGKCTCNAGYSGYDCSDDSGLYFEFEGVTYKLVPEYTSWNKAEENCKKLGGHLATIYSRAFNNRIIAEMTKSKLNGHNLWIGLNDIANERQWRWTNPSAGCKNYFQWQRGEPGGRRESNCVHLYGPGWDTQTGNWNDAPCVNDASSLCEFGAKAQQLCPKPTTPPTKAPGKCSPFNERYPAEQGAPGGITRCTSNGDPHLMTFDGRRYDNYRIGDWVMVKSDRRDFSVHARTHHCWRVACNCGVVVKEGQDVISVNYCGNGRQGNRHNPYVGFMSNKEPLPGTGLERSGRVYRIKLASGAFVQLRINMNHQALWVDINIGLPSFDYKHVDGMCGSWDRNRNNDRTEWRASPQDSLFFYKPAAGKTCLAKDACNPEKKFKAQGGWKKPGLPKYDVVFYPLKLKDESLKSKFLLFEGQEQCDKEREEPTDPNAEVLPTGAPNPTAGLPATPEAFTPSAPKCPTPTGKTTAMATKKCTEQLTQTETYKACKRVLGKRFTITEAVTQCVADVCATDDYKISIDSAFDTMKTKCLDEANEEEKEDITEKTCPNECSGNGKCNNGKCTCNKGYSGYDCSEKEEIGKCAPFNERYPAEQGAPGGITRCTSNGDPHLMTFDGRRYDNYRIGDWVMVKSDRRDFSVHARTHHCWRVACNCGVVVKEGQDVISVNYCGNGRQGNRHNPYVGFMSNKEPAHGTGLERSGRTYRIKLASGAFVQLRINMNHQALWVDINIGLPSFDYKHVDGMCGSWDRNRNNDRTEWRASPKDSLFFYKPAGGKTCLAKDACNPDKKLKAQGGWLNLIFPGQEQCDKEREEPTDPNAEVLPTGAPNPTAGLPATPEAFTPAAPKCPTPTGKTTAMATKKCTEQLTQTETYKACKRVLGKRFTITEAVTQCVADVCATDDYKISIDSAFDTMKTKCLDEANEEEKEDITEKTCPNECSGNGVCSNGKCQCNAGYTGYDCSTRMTTVAPTTEKPKEITWENYANKDCRTDKWEVKGCYNTKVLHVRGKLLVHWRHHIVWKNDGHSAFATSLACACGDAARQHGAKYFGLHFWGECWALDEDEIVEAPQGDCLLADGNYKTKCSKMNHRYDHVCLADKSYYTYKLL